MPNVNIFHNALSFNTKESGEGGGGLSIHVNGDTGGGGGETDPDKRLLDFIYRRLSGKLVLPEWPRSIYYPDQFDFGYSFRDQTELEELTLPDAIDGGVYDYFVTPYTFAGCEKLKKINNFPQNIYKIPDHCFDGCAFDSFEIPDSVTTIGGYAFQKCENLTSIEIPSGVTSLGEFAFNGTKIKVLDLRPCASKLTKNLHVSGMPNLEYLYLDGFTKDIKRIADLPKLKRLIIPEGVQHIGESTSSYAFQNTTVSNGLYLPSSITKIYANTFKSFSGKIYCNFSSGKVSGAPWGANSSNIYYNTPLPSEP